MPPRKLKDVMVVDRTHLARQMYPLLFTSRNRFRLRFADEYQTLFKRSQRLRPDVMVFHCQHPDPNMAFDFPCPTILILPEGLYDLKNRAKSQQLVEVLTRPFYPYDLLSLANQLSRRTGTFPKKKLRKNRKTRQVGVK